MEIACTTWIQGISDLFILGIFLHFSVIDKHRERECEGRGGEEACGEIEGEEADAIVLGQSGGQGWRDEGCYSSSSCEAAEGGSQLRKWSYFVIRYLAAHLWKS